MRRFITYLYAYEGGRKDRNAGFIRVNERNGQVAMQVSIRGNVRSKEDGRVYALVQKDGLQGIVLGEVAPQEAQKEVQLRFTAENVMDSGYRLNDFVGIGICFPGGEYLASCWRDDMAEEIARWNAKQMVAEVREPEGESSKPEVERREIAVMEAQPAELHAAVEEAQVTELVADSETASVMSEPFLAIPTTYRKISLTDIRSLPSPNWHLCNNSFLVHGFFNYHYLVLKTQMEADGEKLYLGVPGIFEKQEAVMALLFGFPEFEALPQEVAGLPMMGTAKIRTTEESGGEARMAEVHAAERRNQNSQPPSTGVFGCWLVPLASDRAQ